MFERENELAQLQRTSGRRYFHPHIYDWPITSIDDADAELPALNWTAKMASEVVKDLDAQWKEISARHVTMYFGLSNLFILKLCATSDGRMPLPSQGTG